ncbi:hypothetical protein DR66_5973 [Delftia acidovorans]|nr:hypothetical protein DR66_5973 [Delftia acidovorans]
MGLLDSQAITINCPKCRRERRETIGKLRLNPKLTCQGCGTTLDIDARSLDSSMKKVDKSLADLKRSFGRFSK